LTYLAETEIHLPGAGQHVTAATLEAFSDSHGMGPHKD